jgi:hypothetical protein
LSGLAVLVLMFVGIMSLSSDRAFGGPDLGGWLCVSGVICLIAWGIAVLVLHFTSIRPSEITAISITLQGAHPEFVRAYETGWAVPPVLPEEAARERWRPSERQPAEDERYRRPEDATRLPPPEEVQEDAP